MGKLQSSLLILSALLCLTWGWEPGQEYVYKYIGRSVAGIYKLKMQNAVIELQSRVVVQSVDENNIIVKLENGQIRRTGKYLVNPYHVGESGDKPEGIDGEEDAILNPEFLGAPFGVSHNKGSITGVQIGSDEPLWVVNFKKSIASQLQVDLTGVRSVGPAPNWQSAPKDGESIVFTTFEDSVTGDCSTSVGVSRLSAVQAYSSEAFKLGSFDAVCKGKPVYKITKTKDLNDCKNSPAWHSTTSGVHECDFGKGNCGEFIKRVTEASYLACGDDFPSLTFVHSYAFSDLLAQPFATKTNGNEQLLNAVIISLRLERKEAISSALSVSSPKSHQSLAYVFGDFHPAQPNLVDAYMKSPAPVSSMHSNIIEALTAVAVDLKDKPDAEQDNIDRLAVTGRVLQMFSLEELKSLWQEIKDQDSIVVTLFVDCVVQSGSNPAVMLIKELVESQQITGVKATWALAALGYHVKTPTRELLHELVNLLKSSPVQSSKTLSQTAMSMVADLLNSACGSQTAAGKKYPVSVMGDFCEAKDGVVVNEFIPLLARELESSDKTFDRIVALATFGSLGLEEILPVLLPVIRGTSGQFDDTAERLRAVLSLHRVVFTAPEKVHPILASLASNVGERSEIRMASLGLLLMSNAPQSLWQKFSANTWFEPSRQVASFTHKLIQSIAQAPPASPLLKSLVKKANIVLPIAKADVAGLPFSFVDIRSDRLDEGITSMMHTVSLRDSNQHWPVYLAHRYSYQLGPLPRAPLSMAMWNFNMSDLWQSILGNLFKSTEKKSASKEAVKSIWDELRATSRPADKRAGLLHINFMDSINRFIDLEKLIESIPAAMAGASKYQSKPYSVNAVKYRMLGEYNMRYASDLGLPVRFLVTLPVLASVQGQVKSDGKGGVKSDIGLTFTWKLTSEIRMELPFSGNYIATGVDVLADFQTPREFNFNYNTQNGQFKIGYTPSSKVTDLVHFHVRPYTVSRNVADSLTPTLEDSRAVHIISVTDKPIEREVSLGGFIGLDVKLMEQSEEAHSDRLSWMEYLGKWDVNSLSNLGFVPLSLRSRKYVVRYDPSGTNAKSISTTYLFQYAVKSGQSNVVYESGASKSTNPTAANDVVSYKPIGPSFRPLLAKVLKNIESGNARLASAVLAAEQKDGSVIQLSSVVGLSKDTRYTKDYIDWQVELSSASKAGGADKKVNYAVCYTAVRKWNSPPNFGFSKNVLEMTEEDNVGFGAQCQHKVRFTAKLSRDKEAGEAAIRSPSGQQCLKDMANGFQYGSSACAAARRLDHTYNRYELQSDAENMNDNWLQLARQFTAWTNHKMYPFVVKHVHAQTNTPGQAKWLIKRDPVSGDNDMTFVRPHETVVAKNVRWAQNNEWARFSPWTFALSQIYYPLNAASDSLTDLLQLVSGGVSESRCYVGDQAVRTFDGAVYNYTLSECPHVLMTDCSQKSKLAVTARQGRDGSAKIVTVVYGQDTIEMNPSTGFVVVNGARTATKGLPKGAHIEIRKTGAFRPVDIVVYPLADGGFMLEIRSIFFYMKVQGSNVELAPPVHMRGRACGLCGDFNQEPNDEFKTADRCAVSSGEVMAASFMLKSGDCSSDSQVSSRLSEEKATCLSADQQFHTQIHDY